MKNFIFTQSKFKTILILHTPYRQTSKITLYFKHYMRSPVSLHVQAPASPPSGVPVEKPCRELPRAGLELLLLDSLHFPIPRFLALSNYATVNVISFSHNNIINQYINKQLFKLSLTSIILVYN